MAKSLQRQGVPIPDRLPTRRQSEGPRPVRRSVRDRTPLDWRMGGTRDTTTYYQYDSPEPSRRAGNSNRSLRRYNPANVGNSAGGGVGGLEAEFLLAIVLLVLLMFANSGASYTERIMSFMKRGSLTCLLFFVLALIASTGASAARIAKAFGALIIVAILITSPVNTVMTDVDKLIKNDWVGTSESANDSTGTADTGTQSGSGGSGSSPTSASSILSDLSKLATIADGQALLQKAAPGIKDVLSKIGIHI